MYLPILSELSLPHLAIIPAMSMKINHFLNHYITFVVILYVFLGNSWIKINTNVSVNISRVVITSLDSLLRQLLTVACKIQPH